MSATTGYCPAPCLQNSWLNTCCKYVVVQREKNPKNNKIKPQTNKPTLKFLKIDFPKKLNL